MDFLQRKMAKDKAEVVRKLPLQRMHAMARQSRIRAFVIAVLHQRDDGVSVTLRVVVNEICSASLCALTGVLTAVVDQLGVGWQGRLRYAF